MFGFFKKKQKRTGYFASGPIFAYTLGGSGLDPMRASTVYACVKVLGESIAMLPWKVYKYGSRKRTDGSMSPYPPKYEQWQHPLNKCLLRQANPAMTALSFRMYMMRSLVLTGDAYAYVVRDSQNRTCELYPVPTSCITTALKADGTIRYDVSFRTGQYIYDCPRSSLFHVCINPEDEYCLHGVNPIALQRRLLNIDDNAIQSLVQQYSNGVNSNLAIQTPDNVWLEQEKFDALKKQIQESYSGVANTGVPLLLEGGLKAIPLGISNKDAQFLELYQFTQEQICKIFRVPPHLIGDLTHATFSNIEHQSLEFLSYTLTPYINAFEQAAFSDLLTPEEQSSYETHLDTTEFDRGDRSSRYASYQIGIQNGILSTNECRAFEDMPPRENGDEYLRPLNMTPSVDDKSGDESET